ncbi:MAG: helix-turn-helix transcriptional regulator [Acidobacteriaceae bacterium]
MRTWQTIRSPVLRRHVHQCAYAAIILSGGYEEAGDGGRFCVRAGDVVLHDRFEAHTNRLSCSGATVLNLKIPRGIHFIPGRATVADPDDLVRASERSQTEALTRLLSRIRRSRIDDPSDWPDLLAADLRRNPTLSLSRWSRTHRLSPWAVSRGFSQVFGISPSAFRARMRARHALQAIEIGSASLANIAAELNFADQPHMTRSVKTLTGQSPVALRSRANRFKTR